MALKDVTATQIGGLDASIIGLDTCCLHSAAPNGYAVNTNLTFARLGDASAVALRDARYPTKALQVKEITVDTANDALVNGVAGWYNRSGKTAPVGKFIVAVAA